MRPTKDIYWIKVEKETEDTIKLNGVEIFRDTSYDPMKLARQHGVVYKTPIVDSTGFDIKEGDRVWFHHFVATENNIVEYADEDGVYQATASQVFLVKRGEDYIPLGHWNFVEQEVKEIETTESGLMLSHLEGDMELHGTVVIGNKELGTKEGSRVLFSKNSEYDMDIDGRSLLRMRNFDILATYEE